MILREMWNGLCDRFGEGIIILMAIIFIYVSVSIYSFFKVGIY